MSLLLRFVITISAKINLSDHFIKAKTAARWKAER